MAKETTSIADIFSQLKDKIVLEDDSSEVYLPNIIEFCESPHYLNLAKDNITLYPMQKVILKSFYRGQTGNEDLVLTDDELKLLFELKLTNVIEKYHSGHIFRELVLVLGRRCVSEDTVLLLADGSRQTIGSLWDAGIKNVDVFSLDESDFRFYKSPNAEIIENGMWDVYEMRLTDGRQIEITDNHPLLTIEGWKQCCDLQEGDRIAVPAAIPAVESDGIQEVEARLLGYMIGDGCCSSGNIFFTCASGGILSDFRTCLDSISDNICIKKDVWSTADSKDIQYKITKKNSEVESYYDPLVQRNKVRPKKNALAHLLDMNGLLGKTARSKFVPHSVFRSELPVIANFLKAIFSCNGTIYNKWSSRNNVFRTNISYTTVSEKLARDLHHLLIRFGILSRLRRRKMKSNFGNTIAFEISISDKKGIQTFMDNIGFVGKSVDLQLPDGDDNSSNNFYRSIPQQVWNYIDHLKDEKHIESDRELLGVQPYSNARCNRQYSPNRAKVDRINDVLQDDHLARLTSPDVVWMPIKSITYMGKKRTFDVSVARDGRHNFIANDIVLHNSGKDFMVSLIALYEAMKLMECPNGSPFEYYGLASGNPIYILTVATSSDQARILFTEIKTRMQSSEYFKGKIDKIEADRVWLLTPEDKKKKKELVEQGLPTSMIPSSVVIMSGHSNSEGLLGKRIYSLLLDEVASFKTTGSSLSGDRIYSALTPATADFRTPNKKQPDGSIMYDSKIISISSPRSEEGILYKLYSGANEAESRLAVRLPTWKVNLKFDEDSLRHEFKFMSPVEFQMEFGAEFSGTGGELFIPSHYVDEAFQLGDEIAPAQKIAGRPGMIYYAHLDPASTSHNYALVVLHVEERIRIKENANGSTSKEKIKIFVVDHIMAWQPTVDESIQVGKVDQYIVDLAKVFRFAMVSYDDFHSLSSIQKLRAKGIPSKITKYRKQYKMQIYSHLEHLLVNHQLSLPRKGPWGGLLERELKCLKRIYVNQGFKIEPDPEAQTNTDDIADALAGACGVAVEIAYAGYPKAGTVYLPQSRDMRQNQWSIGSGRYNDQQFRNIYRRFGKPKSY